MEWLMWLIIIFVVLGIMGRSAEKKKQQEAEQEALKRSREAENYILNSGDPEAIKTLMLARANPSNYTRIMADRMDRGNDKGSDIIKTALGVTTGVVAGNLIANAITSSAISSSLDDMDSELGAVDHSSISDASYSGSNSSWSSGGDDSAIEI